MKNNRKNRKRLKMIQKRNPQGLILNGAHVLTGDDPMTVETVNALGALIKATRNMKI